MGANPAQIEVGDFDEAIEIVEDVVAESKSTSTHANMCLLHRIALHRLTSLPKRLTPI